RRPATCSSIRHRTSPTIARRVTRPSTSPYLSPTTRCGWCIFHGQPGFGTPIEGPMLKPLAALLGVLLIVPVAAQQRAPQNESIRQADLPADLYFPAGDAMRGRLTDTEENRAAADFIRSRFERLGLEPAAPNRSYFQTYNLMTATVGDGNALE